MHMTEVGQESSAALVGIWAQQSQTPAVNFE